MPPWARPAAPTVSGPGAPAFRSESSSAATPPARPARCLGKGLTVRAGRLVRPPWLAASDSWGSPRTAQSPSQGGRAVLRRSPRPQPERGIWSPYRPRCGLDPRKPQAEDADRAPPPGSIHAVAPWRLTRGHYPRPRRNRRLHSRERPIGGNRRLRPAPVGLVGRPRPRARPLAVKLG